MAQTKEKTISASEFKAKCLRILDRLDPQGLLITKRGQPIARIIPARQPDNAALIRSMKDRIKIKGDIFSAGVRWDAESRHPHPRRSAQRRTER